MVVACAGFPTHTRTRRAIKSDGTLCYLYPVTSRGMVKTFRNILLLLARFR